MFKPIASHTLDSSLLKFFHLSHHSVQSQAVISALAQTDAPIRSTPSIQSCSFRCQFRHGLQKVGVPDHAGPRTTVVRTRAIQPSDATPALHACSTMTMRTRGINLF